LRAARVGNAAVASSSAALIERLRSVTSDCAPAAQGEIERTDATTSHSLLRFM
jgi:hypothetical protein